MRETDRGWPGIDNVSPNTHARFVRHATLEAGYVERALGIFLVFCSRETVHGNDNVIHIIIIIYLRTCMRVIRQKSNACSAVSLSVTLVVFLYAFNIHI